MSEIQRHKQSNTNYATWYDKLRDCRDWLLNLKIDSHDGLCIGVPYQANTPFSVFYPF